MHFELPRGQQLLSLLGRLLALDPAVRAARLEELRHEDPGLGARLAVLVDNAERESQTDPNATVVDDDAPILPLPLASDDSEPHTLSGTRIGAYALDSPLGSGGMGVVWRAHRVDGRFEGQVAFKLLHLSLVGRASSVRFEQEGAILARLSHPNIARLLDAGVMPSGQPYIVLELVEGERIDVHCDAAHLGIDARVALFCDVLDAVAHAHRHLVIHRDIKPSNILVSRDGDVKLLDFGIAKLLQEGIEDGPPGDLTRDSGQALTPDYAAPEQLRGETVTTATDVYSLGVLLYQLLTGRHPAMPGRATTVEIVRATLSNEPPRMSFVMSPRTRPGKAPAARDADGPTLAELAAARATSPSRLRRELAGDLDNIVAKALRKSPAERYPTVDALREDLRRWKAGEPVSVRADSWAYRASRFVSRHRVPVAAVTLSFAAIVAGLVGTISQANRANIASRHALEEAQVARDERDNAREQQRLLRGTNEFLQMMMRDAAGGDRGAVRKQLDRARALIAQTRFETPLVRVALQRQISARYEELGDTATATQLLREAIASTEGTDLASPTSGVPVNLACSLARYLTEGNEVGAAIAELDRADRLMAAGAQLSVPSRVECNVNRGIAEIAIGHYARAVTVIRDALSMLDAAGTKAGEQSRVVRSALSFALLQAGRNEEAMSIAKPLLAESLAAQGKASVAVLRRSAIATSITRSSGDPLTALSLSDEDMQDAAQVIGPREDVAIGYEHGRVLLALGRGDEAVASLQHTERAARAQSEAAYLLSLGLAEVEALLASGRLREAERRLAELGGLREEAAHGNRPEQIDALRLQALLALAHGNAKAASHSLDEARRLFETEGGESNRVDFDLSFARATVDLADGATPAALAAADKALAAAKRLAIDPARSCDVGRALLLRSRILGVAGRAQEAADDASAARPMLDATLGPNWPRRESPAAAVATASPPR